MNKKRLYNIAFLVGFCLFVSTVYSQAEASIADVRIKSCKVIFSLKNNSLASIEIPYVSVLCRRGRYLPKYFSIINDTLEVRLFGDEDIIQTGHSLRDSVIIEGERVNTSLFVKPGEKIGFFIPLSKKVEITVIKTLLMGDKVLYAKVP